MDTPEESGESIPLRAKSTADLGIDPLLVPPPLSQGQVEKIIKFAEAAEEMVEALGSLYGDYCKWVLSRVKPMLIPPIGPPLGTQPPSTPPPTTPPP